MATTPAWFLALGSSPMAANREASSDARVRKMPPLLLASMLNVPSSALEVKTGPKLAT